MGTCLGGYGVAIKPLVRPLCGPPSQGKREAFQSRNSNLWGNDLRAHTRYNLAPPLTALSDSVTKGRLVWICSGNAKYAGERQKKFAGPGAKEFQNDKTLGMILQATVAVRENQKLVESRPLAATTPLSHCFRQKDTEQKSQPREKETHLGNFAKAFSKRAGMYESCTLVGRSKRGFVRRWYRRLLENYLEQFKSLDPSAVTSCLSSAFALVEADLRSKPLCTAHTFS